MGEIQAFSKEKLIMGILYHQQEEAELAKNLLKHEFGTIDTQSITMDFSCHSKYYDKQMNGQVYRQFISFDLLVDPSTLAEIKIHTNNIEKKFIRQHIRPINIDPGLINNGRLALATTKDASHRIALHQGIYVELTLFYSRRQWNTFPWTYPDFKIQEVHNILTNIRSLYRKQKNEN